MPELAATGPRLSSVCGEGRGARERLLCCDGAVRVYPSRAAKEYRYVVGERAI